MFLCSTWFAKLPALAVRAPCRPLVGPGGRRRSRLALGGCSAAVSAAAPRASPRRGPSRSAASALALALALSPPWAARRGPPAIARAFSWAARRGPPALADGVLSGGTKE